MVEAEAEGKTVADKASCTNITDDPMEATLRWMMTADQPAGATAGCGNLTDEETGKDAGDGDTALCEAKMDFSDKSVKICLGLPDLVVVLGCVCSRAIGLRLVVEPGDRIFVRTF